MGPAQGTMGTVLWFTLLWTSGCGHSFAAQVLKRNIYFSCAQRERITLSVPSVTSGREFIWERTSHQHNNKTVKIAVIESSNEKLSWTHIDKFFKNGKDFEISMEPLFQNAGVFSFSQTRPENVLIARYEVFALKVEPPLWSSFSRGADVSASCTVSRLQDSATLHWEKEGPHTSNTTLSHKNSAHIIIHSADEHSEGRYSCSLEQNGLLLHNVSNTLSVRKDTYHTSYNLYRDSSETEVVFVCASPSHHRTARWAWVPFLEGKTKTLATVGKEGKVRISTEIDGERFSSDGYDGILFPLRISPVMFQDAGRYSCYVDNSYFSYITLITLQVSAEPPGGLSRNQSVVLNCQISQVIGSVTLAWLRMKGGRGELVKQEVLSEGHPEKMLSLTLPILSGDQLHWACAVFTESMLRAQVPLHLRPLSAQPGWSTETVVRVVIVVLATLGMLKVLMWYCRRRPAMLVQYKYCLSGEIQGVSLQAPAETNGTEFIWEWTSHDGSYTNTRIITIQPNGNHWWEFKKTFITKQGKYDIYLEPELEDGGTFTFIQTKPEKVSLAQVEVFAVKVEPSRWSKVKEGSDATMSCEVSHLPDSATLDWERDREPTANTTLIYNNTAHIIIHSADQYSEGTYNCTLRWNGALIFSIPKPLKVSKGTFGTQHTLYRGSLSSSEVVLICHSLVSYRKAYWRWEPLSGTNTIRVASAEKYKNVSISMEIDKERFSSERYDGSNFPLRISPVKFGDSGMYFCYCEYYPAASVTLVTVEISAEPPSGLSRNQSVVLNCEISLAFGNVTLAWLRMKGGRGELVKQEVLSQGHPKKMLSLTLPILSRDQLHWACAVFTESMLRAQVPLRLILPAPITEPEEPKPGWSTETVVRVVIVVLATLGMLKVLMWYCRRRPAMLVQYKYFLSGEGEGVSLQAPAETNGTEFFWEWTSHDGSYANARIITIPSDGKVKWNLSITRQGKYDIVLQPKLQNAGVFTFIQTKPEKVKVSQFEVFAVKVEPSRWSSVKEGSDVIRSCEVSHLPDSATLDWERDREPTGNTTLIYNNTAHIIIHSADRSSEGTYNCTLRWNGALIFSIPRTLQVYKGTFGTHHILYRGSLSSSEVVLICRSQNSYGTAYWQWAPSSETNELIVASADNNTLISMEIDKERFSSEHYNGSDFPLRISPVKFGDSGRYFCYCDAHRKPMATVTLVTVQVLVQYKYFLSGEGQWVSLQAPAKTKGTEFIWEWTSHDGSYTNTRIITIQPNGKFSWNLPKATKSISKGRTYDIYLRPVLQNAGVYTFIQTKQEKVNMSQFEVFAVKVEPSHWSSVKEGSDVTMSCEVSHLPDSATLDWERDTDPTANTTLIYNNTAHIIIHSADRYSEGTYSCTLRWNGEFIFSIPRTLQVSKGTYGTEHTLYRGSLNSSEVVLICHSLDSYGTAYWQREPSSETNAIRVASGDKNENTSISMKIDKERFSSEHYDGSNFPLRISPVKFGDSGRYFCFCDAHRKPMATVTLVTVQVLVQYKYFLSGEGQGVSLQAPAETNGTEFIWEWTSHDGSYTNARIITIQSDGTFSWNLWKVSITRQGKYDIYLHPKLQNAGVFTFIQTKPEKVKVAQFEVFAAEVKPSRWSSVKEGSDVTMSCEVSHLPDSATLDWERDREPTANTTLIYNNTAHIIIHSADRYSEGTYNCTLRWNGALIFSIPRTLQVYKGTRGTQHTLYRGSLSSSEVVLICRAPASYRTAYWRWASGTNAIIVASADKYENALISMEIDNERFSLERYNGSNFPLRISPVKFGDSGMYFCHFDHWLMATVTLLTVQVSAVPPGGLSRNQSVMLNCEISQVIGSVTLAWLRMKGGRGELVKQEVLSEGHPKKMLSLTLPILSRDQLHWACAVFTESMLRAQVPLHLTLPTPITEPEEPKPGWSTETVIRVVIVVLATLGMLKVLMWYCRRRPAMLVQYKYFLSGEGQRVSLQAPTETNGTEFIWEWTSHDGSYTNARLITIQSDGKFSWNLSKLSITKPGKYDIVLQSKLQNAGVFTFIQTKPEKVNLSQFEVFAVKVEPSRWSRVNEGSDVIRSCEVSHLPDSATLDWERDTEPTANTTLIYNNTAHIIIHSADRSSQGTYSCTLRWNGELIFSIPKTLQVESGMLLWIPVCTREFTKAS
ncbi:uncharacterized protein LOC135251784 isoform X5 [Anguilla rostrata]|uniref:uncharacterized protein LOC135251784 isoform X5 n=1 Tax=Anguilla rostrata TaxID=7938 RepID=UPI0030CAEC3B